MIFLLLTATAFANPKFRCEDTLAKPFFSEFSIAKAIEELGSPNGQIFADVVHGGYYDKLAVKYNMTVEQVKHIAEEGIGHALKYKKLYE